jgi:hypothetical protein
MTEPSEALKAATASVNGRKLHYSPEQTHPHVMRGALYSPRSQGYLTSRLF